MLETLRILGAASVIVAASIGLGRALWNWRPPSFALALVSGTAALSVLFFGLLAAGFYRPPAIWAVLILSIAAGTWKISLRNWHRPPWWAAGIALIYAAFYLVHALAPEIQPDGAGYHLGMPSQWLANGGFTHRIGFFELLPLGIETLYGAAMVLGGPSSAKLVHLAFLGFSCALILQISRRLGICSNAAWAAALLFALAPVTGISSTSAYTDAAMVCAHLALLALLLDWRAKPSAPLALHVGLAAGLCYAIKMSGAIPAMAAFLFILCRRRAAHAFVSAGAAALVSAPWAVRAWWLTSNPIAPLGNAWFDNDAFSAASEWALADYLRTYGLAAWSDIPRQLLVSGESLQGLLGPVFILAPVALIALRRQAGRWLLAAAAVAALPWAMNIGARFLMPPMPFLALALVSVLPLRLLPALLTLHAALSLPMMMDRYSGPHAWRLKGLPWQAAFRLVTEHDYLRKTYLEYNVARMVSRNVRPGEELLDLVGVPLLYSNTPAHGPLPAVVFDQMAQAMAVASMPVPDSLVEARYENNSRFLRGVRVRFSGESKSDASVVELRLERHGQALAPPRYWFLRAWPMPQDAALAIDGNMGTRWRSYQGGKTGHFLEFLFDRPIPFDAIRIVTPATGDGKANIDVYGLGMEHAWHQLPRRCPPALLPRRTLRADASAFLRSKGIRWIIAPTHESGHGPVGRSLMEYPNAWGVDRVEQHEGFWLFRLR